jgi:hypothetical protein
MTNSIVRWVSQNANTVLPRSSAIRPVCQHRPTSGSEKCIAGLVVARPYHRLMHKASLDCSATAVSAGLRDRFTA